MKIKRIPVVLKSSKGREFILDFLVSDSEAAAAEARRFCDEANNVAFAQSRAVLGWEFVRVQETIN